MHHQLVAQETEHMQITTIALQVGANLIIQHCVDVI